MDQMTSHHESQTYAHIVGACSGTLILVIAREIPDTYWIKSYLIMTAPSISVYLSTIANEIKSYVIKRYHHVKSLREERRIIRRIKALNKYPHVTDKDINLLTKMVSDARIREIKKMINSLVD
ncbi:hypothetical protein C7475_1021150 [Chitinophaga sp. S165]|nr:hypothetical protein C7475_1021150 [Chitinophaga sp. S165]